MPMPLPRWWPLALALAIALVALGVWLAGWWASRRQFVRVRVAQRGERTAEDILRARGYAVVGRQVVGRWSITVDGRPVVVSVRADLVVERRGQRLVAEVKTGAMAPDPTLPATRRQLLEYALVFGATEVLLVDVEARAVHVVTFPAIG